MMRMTVMKHKFMRILHRLFYLEAKASFAKSVRTLYQFCNNFVYSEPCQTFQMELFVEIINDFQPLIVFAKRFILDV